MATVWPCTENLGRELNIDDALFSAMRWETDNGRALPLAQLARGTADIIALGCWAYDHGPAGRCGGVLGLSAGQHHHHGAGIVAGQHVGVGQIIRA